MIEFQNDELGKNISFTKYYRTDGREVNTFKFNATGKIIGYSEEITEHGKQWVFEVITERNETYFVLAANGTFIE